MGASKSTRDRAVVKKNILWEKKAKSKSLKRKKAKPGSKWFDRYFNRYMPIFYSERAERNKEILIK
jgi:hypothetical protein